MSKQPDKKPTEEISKVGAAPTSIPDKELRELLVELEHGVGKFDCECWPDEKLKQLENFITKAQLQLVDELMEHAEVYPEKGIGSIKPVYAVPVRILQQYKANLSGKGE